MTEAENELKKIQEVMRRVNQGLKLDPGNVDLLAQRSELLGKQYELTAEKTAILKEHQAAANREFDTAGKAMDPTLMQKYNAEVGVAEAHHANLAKQLEENNKKLEAAKSATSEAATEMGSATAEAKALGQELEAAGAGASVFSDVLSANLVSGAITSGLNLVANGVKKVTGAISDYVAQGMASVQAMEGHSAKLQQIMSNTMELQGGEVDRIMELAQAQERLGVVSAEAQIAGAQELATYLEKSESIEALLPVLNDMAAQQYGYNVTAESTASIATMLGKVMDGQTGALSRYGYSFTEAQEQILKFGTEAERAAVLADVISDSVGGVNQALGETDAGQIIILNRSLEETQAAFGAIALEARAQILEGLLPVFDSATKAILNFVEKNKHHIDTVISVFVNLVQAVATKFNEFKQILDSNLENISRFADYVISFFVSIVNAVKPILDQLIEIIVGALNIIKKYWDVWGEDLIARVKLIFDFIKTSIENAMQAIQGIIDFILGVLTLDFERAFSGIQQYVDAAMRQITNIVNTAINAILSSVNLLITGLNKILKTEIEPIELRAIDNGTSDVVIDVANKSKTAAAEAAKAGVAIGQTFDVVSDTAIDAGYALEELSAQYNNVGSSAKAAASDIADAAKEAEKAEEERIKKMEQEVVKYTEHVAEALTRMYQEEYEAKAEVIDDYLEVIRKSYTQEIEIVTDTTTQKIELLNDEYIEKIRLINDATATALAGINEEIEAELEKMGITNAERAAEIAALRERKDAIKEAREAERLAEEEARYEREKAKLERQIADEETAEKREELILKLAEHEEKWAKTLLERRRKEEEKNIDERIKDIQKEQTEELRAFTATLEEKKRLQEDIINDLSLDLEDDKIQLKVELEESKDNAAIVAAQMVTSGEAGQEAALKVLESYYPDWHKAGSTMLDHIAAGIEANQDVLGDGMEETGIFALEGFIAGLQSKEDDLMAEARRIAEQIEATIRSALDIRSPSRVMRGLGGFVTLGLSTGMEDKINFVKKAAQKLGVAAIPDTQAAASFGVAAGAPGGALMGASDSPVFALNITNFYNNTDRDMDSLMEYAAFYVNSKSRGRG